MSNVNVKKVELKLCPFCGGSPVQEIVRTYNDYQNAVKCSNCRSGTPFKLKATDAFTLWNNRILDIECKCGTWEIEQGHNPACPTLKEEL